MGGSIVDNLHGWITCGQCPRVGHMCTINYSRVEHMWTKGIPLDLINHSETALQNYMVNVWIHVENVVQNHIFTHIIHMSPCDHMAFVRDYHVVICFFTCFRCAIHETINLQYSSTYHMASARN